MVLRNLQLCCRREFKLCHGQLDNVASCGLYAKFNARDMCGVQLPSMKKLNAGFSLIEVLVSMAIVTIASMGAMTVMKNLRDAQAYGDRSVALSALQTQ